jgi:hypothetical protein
MQTYEINIDSENTGVNIISMVSEPAIDELFIKMNKESQTKLILSNIDKQIVIGAVLVPDKVIYRQRMTKDGVEEFNIVFRKEVIEQIAERFINSDSINNVDIEHNEILLNKVNIVSSYILSDDLKDERFNHLPNGSWIVSYKINDKNLWETQVKAGKVKGFSIDGLFNMNSIQLKSVDVVDLISTILTELE